MTADEFLRELALRVAEEPLLHVDNYGDVYAEPTLLIRIDPHDADEFLALTGIRVE